MAFKSGLFALLAGILLSGCAPTAGQAVIQSGGYYQAPRPYYGYGPRYYRPRPRMLVVPPPAVVVYPAPYYRPVPRAYYPVQPQRHYGRGWRR